MERELGGASGRALVQLKAGGARGLHEVDWSGVRLEAAGLDLRQVQEIVEKDEGARTRAFTL